MLLRPLLHPVRMWLHYLHVVPDLAVAIPTPGIRSAGTTFLPFTTISAHRGTADGLLRLMPDVPCLPPIARSCRSARSH